MSITLKVIDKQQSRYTVVEIKIIKQDVNSLF